MTEAAQDSKIAYTLIQLKLNGLSEASIKRCKYALQRISETTNINNPQAVKEFIYNLRVSNATKQSYVTDYNRFCTIHKIQWTKPRYKWERIIPLIPKTDHLKEIIANASPKYATIFTILAETGLEAHELATVKLKHIDAEQGIISAQGCKGHNSRQLRLQPKTADMLRKYLVKYKGDYPFPRSKAMGEAWRTFRDQTAEKLAQPELKNIPMRNLRHYRATTLYAKTKDILLVKNLLGHKKIDTTLFYTQLIAVTEADEWTVRSTNNLNEAMALVEQGFLYVTTVDGFQIFKKRKEA